MTTLGIGVRVYIGFIPSSCVQSGTPGGSVGCKTGTITDGPFEPRTLVFRHQGQLVTNALRVWQVAVDGNSYQSHRIAERVLFPIEDDNHEEPREQEAPAPRESVSA